MVVREGEFVLIPLTSPLGGVVEGFEVVDTELPRRERPPRSVTEALCGKLPRELLHQAPRSYDIIGDVAVVNDIRLPREYWSVFAEALRSVHRHVRVVLVKVGELRGDERVGGYEVAYGGPETETLHREHGCIFKVDITKAFYTPRLSGERLRVAQQVRQGETVVDMFAGVGPFSIIIAKQTPKARVYAVEKNPEAYRYLCENIRLNKVVDRVLPRLGDAGEILRRREFREIADRVVMNLPSKAFEFLDVAIHVAKERAVIHYYTFAERREEKDIASKVVERLAELGAEAGVLDCRVIKELSPSRDMLVLDIKVERKLR